MMQQEEDKSAASDTALLRRFTRQGRQAAFSELVSRYSGLVYSTCLRDIRNAAVAEDAAQAVFLLLARKAPTFGAGTSLAGWLYRTARLVDQPGRMDGFILWHFSESKQVKTNLSILPG